MLVTTQVHSGGYISNTFWFPYSHVWDYTGSHILPFCTTGDITHKVATLPAMNMTWQDHNITWHHMTSHDITWHHMKLHEPTHPISRVQGAENDVRSLKESLSATTGEKQVVLHYQNHIFRVWCRWRNVPGAETGERQTNQQEMKRENT